MDNPIDLLNKADQLIADSLASTALFRDGYAYNN